MASIAEESLPPEKLVRQGLLASHGRMASSRAERAVTPELTGAKGMPGSSPNGFPEASSKAVGVGTDAVIVRTG
jgi:hypothetical protein